MNQPFAQAGTRIIHTALRAFAIMGVLLGACQLWGQSASAPAGATAQSAQPQAGVPSQSLPPAAPVDELAQLRTDLDRMESLQGNMSAEIEFLHDQNLQILLRTNAQLWTILIRDLRRQIDRQNQRGNRDSRQQTGSASPTAPPR